MDEEDRELVFESPIDDCENFIWGRPIHKIEQNEENYARYGGPMPWPPYPIEDLEDTNWQINGLHFDWQRLVEERIRGFMLSKFEDASHVRQLWAIENWNKWCEECDEKGIDRFRHYDELYFPIGDDGKPIMTDETNKALNRAIEESIIISIDYG